MILAIELIIIVILGAIMADLYITDNRRKERLGRIATLNEIWDGRERREAVRFNASMDVEYSMNSKSYPSKSRDISKGGIGLILDEKLEKGMPIRIQIKLPNSKLPIDARGEVAWSSEQKSDSASAKRLFSTGIKFNYIAPKSQADFDNFIKGLEKNATLGHA